MIRTETIEREGRSIAAVLLDRPEKRNALTPGMLEALCEALVQAPKSHDAVVLVEEDRAGRRLLALLHPLALGRRQKARLVEDLPAHRFK